MGLFKAAADQQNSTRIQLSANSIPGAKLSSWIFSFRIDQPKSQDRGGGCSFSRFSKVEQHQGGPEVSKKVVRNFSVICLQKLGSEQGEAYGPADKTLWKDLCGEMVQVQLNHLARPSRKVECVLKFAPVRLRLNCLRLVRPSKLYRPSFLSASFQYIRHISLSMRWDVQSRGSEIVVGECVSQWMWHGYGPIVRSIFLQH